MIEQPQTLTSDTMLHPLHHWHSQLIEICGRIAAALFAIVAAMICYEVTSRYLFLSPTIWAEDLSLFCQIWGTSLGAAWVMKHRALIRIDILTTKLGGLAFKLSQLFSLTVITIFSGFACWYGVIVVDEAVTMGTASASMLGLPLWLTKIAIPIGFGLVVSQAIVDTLTLFSTNKGDE